MEDPFILGGDFNMIRFPWEKSSGNINHFWMNAFNEFIRDNGIKEMDRKGSKYTWSNKQTSPIMSVLDRVLTCTRWDRFYKKASCETLTRVGSDHCPIIVNTLLSTLMIKGLNNSTAFALRWLGYLRGVLESRW
jgi:endonuclease/exonuclease/phosphatase family metal-dependent hydrolase